MRFPIGFTKAQALYRNRMEKAGRVRYPMVLMLEPLYTCNLSCAGCAAERRTGRLRDRMTPETCFNAAEACGAPIVNICGGEPTLYPELKELTEGLIDRGKYVILCTNAIKLDDAVFGIIPPSGRLLLMIHLDGMRETHDFVCGRPGTFDNAVEIIRKGRKLGYCVYLNTTVYKDTQVDEVEALCRMADMLGASGIFISPGYQFEGVDRGLFPDMAHIQAKFRAIRAFSGKYGVSSTPLFLEFAAGMRDLPCSPWSTVNYTPKGWKSPCYLIEGEGYFRDWESFWNATDWPRWESRLDHRCRNCMMHSGFEHSAVNEALKSFRGKLRMAAWMLGG